MKEGRGLAQRIEETALSGRSPLYLWLRSNHAEIARALAATRSSWTALAKTAGEAGIEIKGKEPSPAAVRNAWQRVERDLDQARARRTRKRAERPAARAGEPAKTLPPPSGIAEPEHVPERRFQPKPAALRGGVPKSEGKDG